jgi:hypothetical protein
MTIKLGKHLQPIISKLKTTYQLYNGKIQSLE